MLFGNRSKHCYDSNFVVSLEGHPIEKVSTTKFLGVYIDDDLSWKHHITQVGIKISQCVGVLNRVKHYLPHGVLLSLYYTMIHSHLLYCIIVWGGACQSNLKLIINLQKRALRVITNSEFRAHSSPLFARLGILKVADIYKLQILLFMYKAKFGLLPVSCSKLFTFNADNRYDFRQANDFLMVKFHTEVRKRCISVSGPTLWNCLCVEIKTITSISLFKKVLMRSYLDNY